MATHIMLSKNVKTKKVHTALFHLNGVHNTYDVRCQNGGYLWGDIWSGTGNGGAWWHPGTVPYLALGGSYLGVHILKIHWTVQLVLDPLFTFPEKGCLSSRLSIRSIFKKFFLLLNAYFVSLCASFNLFLYLVVPGLHWCGGLSLAAVSGASPCGAQASHWGDLPSCGA